MGAKEAITIFLSGDVMTGRGIDQILPHPVDPALHEPLVQDARAYVMLAERRTGSIAAPVDFGYIWGDALEVFQWIKPSVRLINLETAVTTSDEPWEGKKVHYRMHPANVGCLASAGIQCCVLANNHVLDWGYAGLLETFRTLEEAGISTTGAGKCVAQAAAPAVLAANNEVRILFFAFGSPTSGVLPEWAATPERPGVNYLPDFSDKAVREVAATLARHTHAGDVVIVSVHWGPNWGNQISSEQVDFAHRLIDQAGVDIIHGHSSHHVKGLEVYKGRLILYGCGDLINDYEGIGRYERYRPELTLMYFPTIELSTGALTGLRLAPLQIRHLRLNHASPDDAAWLQDALNRASTGFGVQVVMAEDGMLIARWG
jgi:poly-gamma-glutamate synthesis protein (capsule biosynthesis protein)